MIVLEKRNSFGELGIRKRFKKPFKKLKRMLIPAKPAERVAMPVKPVPVRPTKPVGLVPVTRTFMPIIKPITLPVTLAKDKRERVITPSGVIYRDTKKLESMISGFETKYPAVSKDIIKRCVSRYAVRPSPVGGFVVFDSIDVRNKINACIISSVRKERREKVPEVIKEIPERKEITPQIPAVTKPVAPMPAVTRPVTPMPTIVPEIPEVPETVEAPDRYVEYSPRITKGMLVEEELYKEPEFTEIPEVIREEIPEVPSEIPEIPKEIPEIQELFGYGQYNSNLLVIAGIAFLGFLVYNIIKR